MPTVTIKAHNLPNQYQTILSNGRHGIVADEPIADEGTDLGFAPYEILTASLAACKVMTMRYLARQKAWDLQDVHAELTLVTERSEGKTVTRIQTSIRLEGNLTEEQTAQLLRVADRCPVHRLLTGEIEIDPAVLIP
jgi:putative redox protein